MPISFQCSQGHQLKVKDELAGKKIKCPKCETVVEVPQSHSDLVEADIIPAVASSKTRVVATQAAAPLEDAGLNSFDFDLPAAPTFAAPMQATAATPGAAQSPASPNMSRAVAAPVANLPGEFGPAAKQALLVYGGSSTLASFILVALTGFFFFSGSVKSSGTAADGGSVIAQSGPASGSDTSASATPSTPAPAELAPTLPGPSTSAPGNDDNASVDASAPNNDEKKAAAKTPASPTDLRELFKNETSQAFVLPNTVHASYYDPATSRYFLGSDTQGVLIYNMQDVLAGKLAPERVLPMGEDLPLSICMQTVNEDQLLLVSAVDKARVHVFKTTDWQEATVMIIPNAGGLIYMNSSPLPGDPTLFFSSYQSTSDLASQVFASYNFKTLQTTQRNKWPVQSMHMSPDGRYIATHWGQSLRVDEWDGQSLQHYNTAKSESPSCSFCIDRLAIGKQLFTPDGGYKLGELPGTDYVESRKSPVAACWSDKELFFLSTNDKRVLLSKPLEPEWISHPQADIKTDRFAAKHTQNQLLFDEKLNALVGRQLDKLLVVKLSALQLPKEPDLRPGSLLATKIDLGQQMVGSLGLPTGVVLKAKPTNEGLSPVNEDSLPTSIAGTAIVRAVPNPAESIVRPDTDIVPAIPLTKEDKVAWKPGKGVNGLNLIRLEAKLGNITREIYCPIRVTIPLINVPFDVFGISCDRDQDTALAWGYSPPEITEGKWQVAVVDLTRKSPIRSAEIPGRILSGCVDKANVYLCIETTKEFDRPMPPYLGPQMPVTDRNVQLSVYDLKTLKESRSTPLTRHARKMESINGKELILDGQIPLSLPAFKLLPTTSYLSGRVGNGWLTGGVLFDKDLRKPQLCLYSPILATKAHEILARPAINSSDLGFAHDSLGGPQLQNWFSDYDFGFQRETPISTFPGAFQVRSGNLELYLLPPSDRGGTGRSLKPESQWRLWEPGQETRGSEDIYPSTVSNQFAVAAYRGRIWIAPLAFILPKVETFQFNQVQDKFVLNAQKPTSVIYRAPKASSYKLVIMIPNPSGSYDAKINLTSKDGKFSIEFDGEELSKLALTRVQRAAEASKIGPAEIKKYMQDCKDEVERIADRKVTGVVVPVYAIVSAQHEDGRGVCGMTHCYLVEVSPNAILKIAQTVR